MNIRTTALWLTFPKLAQQTGLDHCALLRLTSMLWTTRDPSGLPSMSRVYSTLQKLFATMDACGMPHPTLTESDDMGCCPCKGGGAQPVPPQPQVPPTPVYPQPPGPGTTTPPTTTPPTGTPPTTTPPKAPPSQVTGCSNTAQVIAIARGDEKTKYTTITNNIRNILKYVDTGWDGTKNADVRGALAGYSAASEVCGTSYDATVIESSLRGASAFSSAIDKLIADPPGILGTWDAATLATEMNDLSRFHGIVGQCKAAVGAQPPGPGTSTPPGGQPPTTQPDPCDELVTSLRSSQSRDHKTLRAASRACRTIAEYEDITGPTSEADWQRWANMITSLLDDPSRVMSERKDGEFISSRAKMYGATVNQTAFRSSVGMMDAVSLRVHRVVVAMSVAVFDKCMAKLGNFEAADPSDAGAVNEFIESGKPPSNLPDDRPGVSNKAAKDKAMQNEQLRQRLFK